MCNFIFCCLKLGCWFVVYVIWVGTCCLQWWVVVVLLLCWLVCLCLLLVVCFCLGCFNSCYICSFVYVVSCLLFIGWLGLDWWIGVCIDVVVFCWLWLFVFWFWVFVWFEYLFQWWFTCGVVIIWCDLIALWFLLVVVWLFVLLDGSVCLVVDCSISLGDWLFCDYDWFCLVVVIVLLFVLMMGIWSFRLNCWVWFCLGIDWWFVLVGLLCLVGFYWIA